MKKLMYLTLSMMAFSQVSCAGSPVKTKAYEGRIIEFKSGSEGFDTKTFFYEGENEVVAFDAQFTPKLASDAIAHLRKFTNKPISWLVITHPNPDKFNGAPVFQRAGAKVIASSATAIAMPGVHAYKKYYFESVAKMFAAGEYPELAKVDQTFDKKTDLVLRGGERIELRELDRPSVSGNQTVAYIESVKSLLVGDLVHFKDHAWLEGAIIDGKAAPNLNGWKADLLQMTSLFPTETKVYGGRGQAENLKVVVEAQLKYLDRADELVQNYIASLGKSRSELATSEAQRHYIEIQHLFENAYPDYDLGYLIQYGVYGLVNSKL